MMEAPNYKPVIYEKDINVTMNLLKKNNLNLQYLQLAF